MSAPAIAPKLAKLIPLLGSDKDGEVIATVRAIGRTLESTKADWHDLARALTTPLEKTARPNGWRSMVKECFAAPNLLTEREVAFLTTLTRSGRDPTPKQEKWLNDIFARISAWRAA